MRDMYPRGLMTTKCATALLWGIGIAVLPQAGNAQTLAPTPASAAQGPVRVMTLDDALAMAEAKNEQIAIATAGVTRAEGDEMRAKSEIYPQFSASAGYDRALATQFSGIFDSTGPGCTPLTVNPAAPIADRLAEIERALQDCPPSGGLFGGGGSSEGDGESENELPFGQANTHAVPGPPRYRRTQNVLGQRCHGGAGEQG